MISNVCPGLRISQWQPELQVLAIPDTHSTEELFDQSYFSNALQRGEGKRGCDRLQFSWSEDLDSHALCHNKLHGLGKCFLVPHGIIKR